MWKKEKTKPDLEIYVIFDSKVGIYKDPMFSINEWSIIRDYERLVRDEKARDNELVSNAEDFQLFRIGTYSRQTAEIVATTPVHVVNFHEVKSKVISDLNRALPTPTLRDAAQLTQ